MFKNWTIRQKIVGSVTVIILAVSIIFSGISVFTADRGFQDLSEHTLKLKLEADKQALKTYLLLTFGEPELVSGDLRNQAGDLLGAEQDILDTFSDDHSVIVTIFKREGEDFKRVVSTIRNEQGKRVTGTFLGSDSEAYPSVINGELFTGKADILGIPYVTVYDPITNDAGEVIALYSVGIPVADINEIIASARKEALFFILGALIFTLFLGVAGSAFMAYKLNTDLRSVIMGLEGGAEQVSDSAGYLSESSQSLASSASEQAASIEETTSSLEEMSSQIKHTAENAGMAETAVQRMSEAMNEIRDSSTKTTKIIKTIDDIAFQTNLLALNAAVEAARAGEAGKGFAVVAEEVRNLAQRSAEAARTTGKLIRTSQESAENGSDEIDQVLALVLEIAAASKEQAEGISQLNTVMNDMEGNIQGLASSSEETASTAEELSSQANELDHAVDRLSAMIDRKKMKRIERNNGDASMPAQTYKASTVTDRFKSDQNALPVIQEERGETLIPFDEDEVEEFPGF